MKKPLILMILDGFGIAPEKGNAIKAANKPNIDKLFAENPVTQIGASGMDVLLCAVFLLLMPIVFAVSNSFKTMQDAFNTVFQIIPAR